MITMKPKCLRQAIAAATLFALSGYAQSSILEEVVVTATKRAENIQDVPISISAYSGGFLEESGITDLQELSTYAPNLNLSKSSQAANQRIAIRGVGSVGTSAIEPSVAVFIDGIYYPRPGSIVGKLQDVEAVEVLRGPQGTLFGRNASMGALNIRTRKPESEFSAEVWGSAARFDSYSAGVIVNGGLTDRLAGRFSLQHTDRGAFGDSAFDGAEIGKWEDTGFRGSLRFDFSDTVSATLRADWKSIENNGSVIEVVPESVLPRYLDSIAAVLDPDPNDGEPGPTPEVNDPFDYTVNQKHDDFAEDDQGGVSLEVEWLMEKMTFKSLTAYRDWQNDTFESDVIKMPADLLHRITNYSAETVSQELQLMSELDGPLQYVTGIYLYSEKYEIAQDLSFGDDFCSPLVRNLVSAQAGLAAGMLAAQQCEAGPQHRATVSDFSQDAESIAVFAQSTYDVTSTLTATAGVRWTDDEKEGRFSAHNNNPVAGPQSPSNPFGLGIRAEDSADLEFADSQVTWMANLRYTPTDDLMFFLTASTGYKAGGFNSEPGPTVLGENRTFESEEVMSYELGSKATLLDRITLNVTAFRTEIEGFQDRLFDGLTFKTVNAGKLRQQGVEIDIKSQLTDKLFTTLGASYLDSEFLDYPNGTNLPGFDQSQVQDLTGARNNFSPNWQASMTLEWRDSLTEQLEWFVRGEYQFVDEQSTSGQTDNNPASVQDAYSLVNARLGLSELGGAWNLTFFGRNLGGEGYCQTAFYQPLAKAFGVTDPETGNAMTRCVVNERETYGVEYRYRF